MTFPERFNEKYYKPVDIKECREALERFIRGEPRLCIPAHPDDDDFLISRALTELERLRTRPGIIR